MADAGWCLLEFEDIVPRIYLTCSVLNKQGEIAIIGGMHCEKKLLEIAIFNSNTGLITQTKKVRHSFVT